MRKIVCSLLLVFLLCSCTVVQNLNFENNTNYSGSSITLFSTDEFFVNVLEDLSSWQENGNNDPILDVAVSEFEYNLILSDVTNNVVFNKLDDNTYGGSFTFDSFEQLTKDLTDNYPDQNLVKIEQLEDEKSRFVLNISLETYNVLEAVVPFLTDDNFKVWGPVYNNPPYDEITEEDYKDMVSWVLGEEGPESIDNSMVAIRLNLPKPVLETNGNLIDEKTVEFSFPLIDFLLLHEPIIFWCEF